MCSGKASEGFRNESAQLPVVFSARALSEGLRAIYDEQIDVRTEIERHIFEETLRLFNEATAQGLAESYDPALITDRFLQELRTNNAVFSAFRTHRMQNDIAAQLIDPITGQLKSFDRWKLDIQGMTDHYCHAWLQTEYDTAVIRAHQAADWKHFLEEADVLPNIRWMPTTSITPDPLHEHYWTKKLTLPVNHPFWQEHRPGDRWNCKCSLMQTDEPVNASALDGWTPPLPQPGLDNNPAQDGQIFSDTHPYFTEAYPGAQQAVNNLLRKRSPSSLRRTEEEKERIQREWEERKSIRANEAAIAERLQMKIPKRTMTFDEANDMRSNPHFAEARKYQVNCQSCVVSHELRMRGWDVEAIGNNKRADSLPRRLSYRTQSAWIDRQTNSEPAVIGASDFADMAKKADKVGRYHVKWGWKGGRSGHIITFERTADGAFFYDPQSGTRYTLEEITAEWGKSIRENSMQFYRVDTMNANPGFVRVCQKKPKQRKTKRSET